MPRGRKPLYSEEKVEKILAALRKGHSRKSACEHVNISEDTFGRWMKDAAFADRVTQAEAQMEVDALDLLWEACRRDVLKTKIKQLPGKDGKEGVTIKEITKTTEYDTSTVKWLLARRRPHNFAASREDLSGADSGQAELDKMIAGLARKIGARPVPSDDLDIESL